MPAEEIRIRGLVQGVGFRPFIWRLATRFGLTGEVLNDGEGVLVRASGDQLDGFARAIRTEAPRLARVQSVVRRSLASCPNWPGFTIIASGGGVRDTGATPDAAICPDCRAEIADRDERRHGYAFTNCTNCGPRFSIIEAIPYDRAATTMRHFKMCPACRAEYDNPADRRFHAQPIACPACGPSLSLIRDDAAAPGDPLEEAARLILDGGILALKGLGGFHLACDATQEAACAQLRLRKRRPDKPFALMAASIEMVRRYARPSRAEAELLADPAAPIVLIEGKGRGLADSVAPRLDLLGWMLPYTPLHMLLCERIGRPLVMTSGNLSGEPQAIGNEEAFRKLAAFADGFLVHDRDIARRLDDSVAAVTAGASRVLRRARGFAPAPLPMPSGFASALHVLALGGELKSAICFADGREALLSHHMGDLEDALSYDEFEASIRDYEQLFGAAPDVVACDAHPHYRSTLKAQQLAEARNLPLVPVQHHHAHIASAMAENGWPVDGAKVLGVSMDGTGYGPGGTVWGGEFLLCSYAGFERLGMLTQVALPGSTAAVREPWRNLLAQLTAAFGPDAVSGRIETAGLAAAFAQKPVDAVMAMIANGFNTPLSSSAGRLFDAVAAAIDCSFDGISYEGQAAMEAESLARQEKAGAEAYLFGRIERDGLTLLDPAPMWEELLDDRARGVARSRIAARFHTGFAEATAQLAVDLAQSSGAAAIALSGGVMQNGLLMELMLRELEGCSLPVLSQREVPSNDGGLALGQAAIAAAQVLG